MKKNNEVATKLRAISGKLKSAWALQVGFDGRVNGLLPDIISLPSAEIDEHLDSVAKGDQKREWMLALIAKEHLFHPSLHHRIPGWLEDESFPFRDRVIRAIGQFRLRAYAERIAGLYLKFSAIEEVTLEKIEIMSAALGAISELKMTEFCEMLRPAIASDNTFQNCALVASLQDTPGFDAEPFFRKWFRESEVVDQIENTERYLAKEITRYEWDTRNNEARVKWDLADYYSAYAKGEVFYFLLEHIDFETSSFSSNSLSHSIVCRGSRASWIIAKANGWRVNDHESTKECFQRQVSFGRAIWQALRENPMLAFQSQCPVTYEYPRNHKIHKRIAGLLKVHPRVIEENSEHGFTLRESEKGDEVILAIEKPDWKIVRLRESDRAALQSGTIPTLELYFRYSNKGALVAFRDQILLYAHDYHNKWAQKLIRKAEKARTKKAAIAITP